MKTHKIWDGDLPLIYKRRYRMGLVIALVAAISMLLGLYYSKMMKSLPERITILSNREEAFDFSLPMEAQLENVQAGTFFINQEPLTEEQLRLNFSDSFTVTANTTGSYPMSLRLFGIFQMKQVLLDVIETTEIIPMGVPIGIIAQTDGVLVLGTGSVTDQYGRSHEPDDTLLNSGDYICAVDNSAITTKEELIAILQQVKTSSVELTVRRENVIIKVEMPILISASGENKLGVWVRDDTQGIGTMTFITSTGEFGALGHGITDVDTGILMKFAHGEIYSAEINSIIKGRDGEPGELTGVIHQGDKARIGELMFNTAQGIGGELCTRPEQIQRMFSLRNMKPYEIAFWKEVKVGPATILCTVGGEMQEYDIEIEKIEPNGDNLSKGLIIHITDEDLIKQTGGIVQGMSGSPIIQNGKLIGAVTHVFVRDATRGYGVFIENMLKAK